MLQAFFDFVWEKEMLVDEFVIGLHTRLDKISKLNMNDELTGHLLLSQANLNSQDRNIIIGSSMGTTSSRRYPQA